MCSAPPIASGTISRDLLRQLIALRQGLLPESHGVDFADVDQAVRSLGSLQLDPLTIVSRSHDLVLHARVPNYRSSMLTDAVYSQRSLFEYGGVLAVHPQEHLPYWRRHMAARRQDSRYVAAMASLGDDGRRLQRILTAHGPQTTREIALRLGEQRTPRSSTGSYRSQHVTNQGLYQLWLGGRVITYDRTASFERVYGSSASRLRMASPQETVTFFLRHTLLKQSLSSVSDLRSSLAGALHQRVTKTDCEAAIARGERTGTITRIHVEGKRDQFYLLQDVASVIERLADTVRRVDPSDRTVSLLSPLDPMVAAARRLFAYDYIWEIYKPEAKRRYGPFTMPILYGHQLVGRADLRTDRAGSALVVNGLWLEDASLLGNEKFIDRLREALWRLADFAGVDSVQIIRGEPQAWITASRPRLSR
jgi:uncharacterized protein YcaQ